MSPETKSSIDATGMADIDCFLVGSASLEPDIKDMVAMISAAQSEYLKSISCCSFVVAFFFLALMLARRMEPGRLSANS